ncbi:MAG: sortase [Clostridia bacterium]|nr:sortase [Clostridia bacterium]
MADWRDRESWITRNNIQRREGWGLGQLDDFEAPQVHTPAVQKNVVDAVISSVTAAGNAVISLVTGLLAAALVLYSGYAIFDSLSTQMRAESSWDLLQYKPELTDDNAEPGASELSALVPDYRAWITMYDTAIDYPVMQGPNDLYYASHDIYGQSSLTGAIYLAAGNDGTFADSYNLIYGHHMQSGAMFGGLDKYYNPDGDNSYIASHKTGVIAAPTGVYDVEVFAVVRTDAYESNVYTVGDRRGSITDAENLLEFLQAVREGTAVTTGVGTTVTYFDEAAARDAEKIVALSTCFDAVTNGRLVVFGKMVKRSLIDLTASGYTGLYDGETHGLTAINVTYTDDTVIEYSTDGGHTWTEWTNWATGEGGPTITNAGTVRVLLRATSESHGTDTEEVTLRVNAKAVTVTVNDATKRYGEPDPEFTATVEGTLNGDEVSFTISRSGDIENPGVYSGALVATGAHEQGNYVLTFVNGDFTILAPTPTPTPGGSGTATATPTVTPTATPAADALKLTIRYRYLDGSEAAQSVTLYIEEGTAYTVASPEIAGATASDAAVSGVMPNHDVERTVFYIEENGEFAENGDKPLNLDSAFIQVGDCFE